MLLADSKEGRAIRRYGDAAQLTGAKRQPDVGIHVLVGLHT
jgi:hypothetical protein